PALVSNGRIAPAPTSESRPTSEAVSPTSVKSRFWLLRKQDLALARPLMKWISSMHSRRLSKALLAILGSGLLLRLILAYLILPASGLDQYPYTAWGLELSSNGPGRFYADMPYPDYPPGYLYVLWMIGVLSQKVAHSTGKDVQSVMYLLLKLPPMLLDVGTGLLIFWLAQHLRREAKRTQRAALTAAAIYVFNPVVLYDSAVWGQ